MECVYGGCILNMFCVGSWFVVVVLRVDVWIWEEWWLVMYVVIDNVRGMV